MEVLEIREKIEDKLKKILKKENIEFNVKTDAYGHSAGDSVENLLKINLSDNEWKIFFTHEFIEKILEIYGENRDVLEQFLENIWWGNMKIHTKKQINEFFSGKSVSSYQQAGADIVLFYGENLKENPEKIILINAKSHNLDRNSRAPNIMSAQRILENCNVLLKKNMLDETEYWFIGVDYSPIEDKKDIGEVKSFHLKDLFKINTNSISQINFDAAIQIQSHVNDMEEINQNKKEFIMSLNNIFIDAWNTHSEKKSEKYGKLYSDICKELKKD